MDQGKDDMNTGGCLGESGRAELIAEQIERTRIQMDATIDELEEKLQPREMVREVFDMFSSLKDTDYLKNLAHRAQCSATEMVRNHPIPLALIGAGIGWMLVRGSRSRRTEESQWYDEEEFETFGEQEAEIGQYDEYAEQEPAVRSRTSRARERISQAAHRAGDMIGRARQGARSARETARERAEGLRNRAEQSYEYGRERIAEHPVMAALGAWGVGFLAGLALPRTNLEDELMGDAADTFRGRAKGAGEDLYRKAEETAGAAGQAAIDKAREEGILSSPSEQAVGQTINC